MVIRSLSKFWYEINQTRECNCSDDNDNYSLIKWCLNGLLNFKLSLNWMRKVNRTIRKRSFMYSVVFDHSTESMTSFRSQSRMKIKPVYDYSPFLHSLIIKWSFELCSYASKIVEQRYYYSDSFIMLYVINR